MKLLRVVIVTALAIFLTGLVSSTQGAPQCCIGGKYRATFKDSTAPDHMCQTSGEVHGGYFVFHQPQCEPRFRGTLLDAQGNKIFYITGVIAPIGEGKCKFKGTAFGVPGTEFEGENDVTMKAIFYKVGDRWHIKGTFDNPDGCDGTFKGAKQ